MKLAYLHAVGTGSQFQWQWCSADKQEKSKNTFAYFFDCQADAQKHGYSAEFAGSDQGAYGDRSVPRPGH